MVDVMGNYRAKTINRNDVPKLNVCGTTSGQGRGGLRTLDRKAHSVECCPAASQGNRLELLSGPRVAQVTVGDKPSTWICEGCDVKVLRQRFAIFSGIASVQPAHPAQETPWPNSITCIRFWD